MTHTTSTTTTSSSKNPGSTGRTEPVSGLRRHEGGCHCGAVRYAATLDLQRGSHCNCTICTKTASTNSILKPAAFTLLQGADDITTYGMRSFCKRCGIHMFGAGDLPELGGAFVSVNLNTIDGFDVLEATLVHWDGRHDNWAAGPRPQRWPVRAS